MSTDYAAAVIHWRRHLHDIDQVSSATVSSMLFACHRWIESNPDGAESVEGRSVLDVKIELELWLSSRGLKYLG